MSKSIARNILVLVKCKRDMDSCDTTRYIDNLHDAYLSDMPNDTILRIVNNITVAARREINMLKAQRYTDISNACQDITHA